jgi:metal-responsive CopG/Arc/MetJ family transcriptional regulator
MPVSTFYTPDTELLDAVKRVAAEQRISRSELIRDILSRELRVPQDHVPWQRFTSDD